MKAKLRQTQRHSAGPAPYIQSAQRPSALRQKLLQVGKREIEAQSAFGRLEVGGVFVRAAQEAFGVETGVHLLHAPFARAVANSEAAKYSSVYPMNQERQVGH